MPEEIADEVKTYSEDEYTGLKLKLDEFRTNNVKLLKDMESLSAKFEGVDIDAYNQLLVKQEALNKKKLIDAGKIDELLEEKTKQMRVAHNKELEKSHKVNESLQDQLAKLVIDNAVRDSATVNGV